MKGKAEIKVRGLIGQEWNECFEGVEIRHEENTSIISFCFKDESHFHGIMDWIRDLNISIISINGSQEN